MLLLEFTAFFLFVLVYGYLVPAGLFYYLYHVRQDPRKERLRIQQLRPTGRQIRREIKMSLVTVLIFAVMATAVYQLCRLIRGPLDSRPVCYRRSASASRPILRQHKHIEPPI